MRYILPLFVAAVSIQIRVETSNKQYNAYQKGVEANQKGNRSEALKFFSETCGSGDPRGCVAIGELHNRAGNREKAKKTFQVVCEDKIGEGCFKFAQLLKSKSEQNKYYKLGCDLGSSNACDEIGCEFEKAKEISEAKKYYTMSCTLNETPKNLHQLSGGCLALANLENKKGNPHCPNRF
jgi:TPR repeat protein